MKIDVSEVLKAIGNEMTIEESENISFPQDDLILTKPVKFKIHLVSTGRTILLKGKLKTMVKLTCCRCLKDFDYSISIDIEEEYSKKPPIVKSKVKEAELKEKDLIFKIEDDNTIDLSETIRQNLLISLPIKPLCTPSCKGIEEKRQKEKQVDPRLAKLKNILKK